MKPGRELDALVAEKVMGAVDHGYALMQGTTVLRIREVSGSHYTASLHHYSTDIAAAWEVVEKMHNAIGSILVTSDESVSVEFWSDEMYTIGRAVAPTAPHAICLAALRAVGVEVDDG